MQRNYFIVFGPPGSGKGTQVKKLAERLKLPAVSTGDLLRAEIKKKTEIGLSVEKILAKGRLVSDDIVGKLLLKRLRKKDTSMGVIFDGYPRRLSQQKFLLTILDKIKEAYVIFPVVIDVSDEEVVRRISGRRSCVCGAVYHIDTNPSKVKGICDICGNKLYTRDDDKPAVIRARLKTYHKESNSILDYWREQSRLIEINGEQAIDQVDKDLMFKLKMFI